MIIRCRVRQSSDTGGTISSCRVAQDSSSTASYLIKEGSSSESCAGLPSPNPSLMGKVIVYREIRH